MKARANTPRKYYEACLCYACCLVSGATDPQAEHFLGIRINRLAAWMRKKFADRADHAMHKISAAACRKALS